MDYEMMKKNTHCLLRCNEGKSLLYSVLVFLCQIFVQYPLVAKPIIFHNLPEISTDNLSLFLQRFVLSPHPMGTLAQIKLAQDYADTFQSMGFETEKQKFQVEVPYLSFSGELKEEKKTRLVQGQNIVASLAGNENCSLIFASHYDTKKFTAFKFVGANDGGSSTVLLLELARVTGLFRQLNRFEKQSFGRCDLHFVLLDGEEAFLPNWTDGEQLLGLQDNLYGSRNFVQNNLTKSVFGKNLVSKKPIKGVFVIDMIGHKKQKISITNHSDSWLTKIFLAGKENIDIKSTDLDITDDHVPFIHGGFPVVHMIDWNNLDEWHTEKDNPSIVNIEKIKNLGNIFLNFLRKPDVAGVSK